MNTDSIEYKNLAKGIEQDFNSRYDTKDKVQSQLDYLNMTLDNMRLKHAETLKRLKLIPGIVYSDFDAGIIDVDRTRFKLRRHIKLLNRFNELNKQLINLSLAYSLSLNSRNRLFKRLKDF